MIRAAVIALGVLPTVVAADLSDYVGTWCQQGGPEAMHVDETGQLGFNEHTICEWKGGPPTFSDIGFVGTLSCHNTYVSGQNEDGSFQIVEAFHRRGLLFTAAALPPDQFGGRYLSVMMSDWDMAVEFGPCG